MSSNHIRPTSEAFQYGAYLGALKVGMERFVENIAAGMAAAIEASRKPRPAQTIEEWERRRQAAYLLQIDRERQIGRAHVKRKADELRRELGLS